MGLSAATTPIRRKHCVNSKVYYTTTRINGEHMEQTTYRHACAVLTTAGYNVNNVVALHVFLAGVLLFTPLQERDLYCKSYV